MTDERATVPIISRSRLEFLVDGVFAIALTILVLELKVPELADRRSVPELGQALAHEAPTFLSYLGGFVLLVNPAFIAPERCAVVHALFDPASGELAKPCESHDR